MLKKLTLGVTAVAAVLALSAFLADKYLLRARYEAALAAHEQATRELLPRYVALRDTLGPTLPWLSTGGDDAGPFLNPQLTWQGASGPVRGTLTVPAAQQALLREWGKAWLEKGRAADLPSLDFAWLTQLGKYGHWSLVPGGPLEKGPVRWMYAPIPAFIDLLYLAKLRLLLAVKSGEGLDVAAAEVEHLALLCGSTETLVGEMVGLALLSAVSEARGQGVPASQEGFKKLLRATMVYGTVLIDDATARAALPTDRPLAGRCTALNEALGTTLWLRHLLEEPQRSRFERFDAALEQPPPGCRLELGRRMAETVKAMKDPYLETLDVSDGGVPTGLEGYSSSGPLGSRAAMTLLSLGADAAEVRALLAAAPDAGP